MDKYATILLDNQLIEELVMKNVTCQSLLNAFTQILLLPLLLISFSIDFSDPRQLVYFLIALSLLAGLLYLEKVRPQYKWQIATSTAALLLLYLHLVI